MRQIVLLRGINIGPRNRIAMPQLRQLLSAAGFQDVATYLQSGNVVLASNATPKQLAATCKKLIADAFSLDIDVVTRTRDELADIVERNPLGAVAINPKRYQVSFLAERPHPDLTQKLTQLAIAPERVEAIGREIYAWHPDGIAHSRLWAHLAAPKLGITATARNWTTVTNLLALADR